jgi:hypothetical protein
MQEAWASLPDQIRGASASLAEMSEEGRAHFDPLMSHLAALGPDDLFEFVVDRTVSGLVDLVEGG